jgi:hypothetical protein
VQVLDFFDFMDDQPLDELQKMEKFFKVMLSLEKKCSLKMKNVFEIGKLDMYDPPYFMYPEADRFHILTRSSYQKMYKEKFWYHF